MVSGMFAKLTTIAAITLLLSGCATAPGVAPTPEPKSSAQTAFVAGFRALFPESARIGQTDLQILDGATEMCDGIRHQGLQAYKNQILAGVDGDEAQRRITDLVDLASRTVC